MNFDFQQLYDKADEKFQQNWPLFKSAMKDYVKSTEGTALFYYSIRESS